MSLWRWGSKSQYKFSTNALNISVFHKTSLCPSLLKTHFFGKKDGKINNPYNIAHKNAEIQAGKAQEVKTNIVTRTEGKTPLNTHNKANRGCKHSWGK